MATTNTAPAPAGFALSPRSIFMTNVNDTGDDVMVFTRLDAETLKKAYTKSGKVTFDECYEVPEKDVGVYIYEPCWLSAAEEAKALELAAA